MGIKDRREETAEAMRKRRMKGISRGERRSKPKIGNEKHMDCVSKSGDEKRKRRYRQ